MFITLAPWAPLRRYSDPRSRICAACSKQVATLGKFPLPVEIVQFGAAVTAGRLEAILRDMALIPDVRQRRNGVEPFITDGGNFIFDCHVERIPEPEALAHALETQTGIVEHGLFIGIAARAYVASEQGVEHLTA